MASYKVAQDVEAEDKLIGPFSFRQFIYLVIAVMAGIIAYGLSRIFMPLFIIPVPLVVFFLILALPLKKDQPMEVYLAAIVSFYIKPRKRLWQPDGIESMIEITAPHSDDRPLTKDISSNEAERRLAYLATIADSQGWSVRNTGLVGTSDTSMVGDVYNEAVSYQTEFDEGSAVERSFENMISQADSARRQSLIENMRKQSTTTPAPADTQPGLAPTQSNPPSTDDSLQFNPYPSSMRQHVIQPNPQPPAATPTPVVTSQPTPAPAPISQSPPQVQTPAPEPPQSTSDTPVSPDIISLANNNDLSIETIAREAHRIEEKHKRNDDEVFISLR